MSKDRPQRQCIKDDNGYLPKYNRVEHAHFNLRGVTMPKDEGERG